MQYIIDRDDWELATHETLPQGQDHVVVQKVESDSESLESWSHDKLTPPQKEQYQVIPIGESFQTSRTLFRVKCVSCAKLLHPSTSDPSHYIKIHEGLEH